MVMLDKILAGFTDEEISRVLAGDADLSNWYENIRAPESRELTNAYFNFVPRPDDPARFDQQHSFVYNRDPVSFMIGGNAAGTTECATAKMSKFVLRDQAPPRKDTPFWIISNTYEQVGGTIWKEKVLNHGHIPRCEIDWERISWRDQKMGHPAAVPLKPWPTNRGGHPNKNWVLEFKSFDQGREAMQARSIGGFFFSEQFPLDIFLEVLRGCREYMFPGGQFAEFTPIDPELCLWVETIMDEPPPGWKFYRANTEKNKNNLREGWFEQFFAMVPEELMETRMTGALAIFAGTIFQSYSPVVHVKPEKFFEVLPQGLTWGLGTDWGASEEHPHATVLGGWDGMGDWYIPDEYWSASQSLITSDHARKIVEMCKAWGWPTVSRKNSDGVKYDGLIIDDFHRMNYADPSRPGEILEFTMWGVPSAPANNRVYDGINTMRTLFRPRPGPDPRPRILISERCIHLKDELRKYRWKKGRKPTAGNYTNPTVAAPIPLKRDDDTCFIEGTEIQLGSGQLINIVDVRRGDFLRSHCGIAKALSDAICTGHREVFRITLEDGTELTGTAGHPLASGINEWVNLIGSKNHLLNVSSQGHGRSELEPAGSGCRSFATTAQFGDDTRILATRQCGDIFTAALAQRESDIPNLFTGRYTSTFMDQFPTAAISTTERNALTIISQETWNVLPNRSTPRNISQTDLPRATSEYFWTSKRSARSAERNSRFPTRTAIEKCFAPQNALNYQFALCGSAASAENPFHEQLPARGKLAAGNAKANSAAVCDQRQPLICALSAENLSPQEARLLARQNVRLVNVAKVERLPGKFAVFNLATSHGTYFANGVLVSNCDAARYLIHTNTVRAGGGVKRAEQSHPVNTSIGIATGLGSRTVQLDRKGR